jgi:hypothetical protein
MATGCKAKEPTTTTAQAKHVMPCAHCSQPVPVSKGRPVAPYGIVHEECFRYEMFHTHSSLFCQSLFCSIASRATAAHTPCLPTRSLDHSPAPPTVLPRPRTDTSICTLPLCDVCRCSAFGCGATLETGKFCTRDDRAFCLDHKHSGTVEPPTQLCAV